MSVCLAPRGDDDEQHVLRGNQMRRQFDGRPGVVGEDEQHCRCHGVLVGYISRQWQLNVKRHTCQNDLQQAGLA